MEIEEYLNQIADASGKPKIGDLATLSGLDAASASAAPAAAPAAPAPAGK